LPQGCAKKIQVQLLLAHLPLQLRDPTLGSSRRIVGRRRHRNRLIPDGRYQQGAAYLL